MKVKIEKIKFNGQFNKEESELIESYLQKTIKDYNEGQDPSKFDENIISFERNRNLAITLAYNEIIVSRAY